MLWTITPFYTVPRLLDNRYVKSAATRKATEAQGLKLARQLAVVRERAKANREALEVRGSGGRVKDRHTLCFSSHFLAYTCVIVDPVRRV